MALLADLSAYIASLLIWMACVPFLILFLVSPNEKTVRTSQRKERRRDVAARLQTRADKHIDFKKI